MAEKPSNTQARESVNAEDSGNEFNRRRVLQSGATAALASVAGLASGAGTATASSGTGDFEVEKLTASLDRLEAAQPLLNKLAAEGLISQASPKAFSDAPLGKNDTGSAVLKYGSRVVHTYVIRSNGTKLTVNLSDQQNPYALFAPDGSGPGKRIHYEQVNSAVDEFTIEYDSKDVTAQDCGSNCGGVTCSPAGNCWLDNRQCEESCRDDGDGYEYCHDDCCCCC